MHHNGRGWGHHHHGEGRSEPHGFGPHRHHHGPGGHEGPEGHDGPGRFGWGGGRRGPWWGGQGRPRVRRGNVRTAVLVLLSENPSNGYQLIQQISQRSGGVWEPSPGSIYPALQLLQDEGLVTASESDGKRLFSLTDAGLTYAEERRTELNAVWDTVSGTVDNSTAELRNLIKQVAIAVMQVAGTGTEPQVAEARRLLTQTRRQLYGILAAEEPTSTAQSSGEPESV
jgi:DNA-binding PadR family transcriptional regulator